MYEYSIGKTAVVGVIVLLTSVGVIGSLTYGAGIDDRERTKQLRACAEAGGEYVREDGDFECRRPDGSNTR